MCVDEERVMMRDRFTLSCRASAPGLLALALAGLILPPIAAGAPDRPLPGPVPGPAPRYTTALEASLDWGDLGPDWRKELSMYGSENLLVHWGSKAPSVGKGRWQITDASDVLLAQAEVGAAASPGDWYAFFLNPK